MYIMKKIIIIELWFLIDTKVLAWMYCCVDVYSNYILLYVYWYVYYDFTIQDPFMVYQLLLVLVPSINGSNFN